MGRREPIDLRRVITDKSGRLSPLIPRSLLGWLERTVHVREINAILDRLEGVTGMSFVDAALAELGVTVRARYPERLDSARRPLVVANHPLGGLDGLALLQIVGRRVDRVLLPANDLLMNLENLRPLLVPVNKHGSNRDNRSAFDAAFGDASAVVHFPAGLCSRKKGSVVRDLDWQKSFIVRAKRFERDLVPVLVTGRNSEFFYNLARLRRWIGLRFNVEMLFLVDEMFRQRGRTIDLTFGHPVRWELLDASRTSWAWARSLRAHTYRLGNDPDARL